jgi:hypothetical protein
VQQYGPNFSRKIHLGRVSLKSTTGCVENEKLVRSDLTFTCREPKVRRSDVLACLEIIPSEPLEVVLVFENQCYERSTKLTNDDVVRWFDHLLDQVRVCAQTKGLTVVNSFLDPCLGRFRAEFDLARGAATT